MTTLAEKQIELDGLKAARSSGILTVRHGDQSITYRSLAEIEKSISVLEKEIGVLSSDQPRRVRYAYQSGKGL